MIWSKEKLRFIIIRTIGNFFLLFSIWGMAMTFGPALYMEAIYRINQVRNIRYTVAQIFPTPTPSLSLGASPIPTQIIDKRRFVVTPSPTPFVQTTFFGQLTGGDKVEILSPVSSQFGLVIPKIGANAPVLPNVDAGRSDVYLAALQKGVAHAFGTVFPGVTGNIFLFAHSTDSFWNVGRYNAIFFLLKELENGDEVDIFYKGRRYIYRVVNKLIVDPSEVRYLTETTPYEQLTLQTCWPPGTTLKRLIILARPERDLDRG